QEIAIEAARDVRDFYDQRAESADEPSTAAGAQGRHLLVLSIDATGVNMIPSGLRTPAPPRPARSRPRPSSPARNAPDAPAWPASPPATTPSPPPRTAADILPRDAPERAERKKGPAAKNRHMDASLEHSTATMVTTLFDQAERRDPEHLRRWIVL